MRTVIWSLVGGAVAVLVLFGSGRATGDENDGDSGPVALTTEFGPQLGQGTFRVYEDSVSEANLVAWVWRRPDLADDVRMEYWVLRSNFPLMSGSGTSATKLVFKAVVSAGSALHHHDALATPQHYKFAKFQEWIATQGGHGDTAVPPEEMESLDVLVHSIFKIQ